MGDESSINCTILSCEILYDDKSEVKSTRRAKGEEGAE
jgi:hypothetical protein